MNGEFAKGRRKLADVSKESLITPPCDTEFISPVLGPLLTAGKPKFLRFYQLIKLLNDTISVSVIFHFVLIHHALNYSAIQISNR